MWVIFVFSILGYMFPIEQSLTSVHYLNIVSDQMHLLMATVFLPGYCIYQQDNALWHTGHNSPESDSMNVLASFKLCPNLQIQKILVVPFGNPKLCYYTTILQCSSVAGQLAFGTRYLRLPIKTLSMLIPVCVLTVLRVKSRFM